MKKILLGILPLLFLAACTGNKTEEAATEVSSADTSVATKPPPASELLDMSTTAPIKAGMDAFARGDIDGMTASYADNIAYRWSSGDSLIGKQAVKDYYAGRWKIIDSLTISNHIFLPVKVNEPQNQYHTPGDWILDWAMVSVKYKNGKKIAFWIHQANHINDAGKVDQVVQFIDKAPIMAATKGSTAKL